MLGSEMNKSDMLSGRSAEQWARYLRPLCLVMFALTTATAVAYFGLGVTADTVPRWLYAMAGLVVVSYVLVAFTLIATLLKAIRESKAGYTTRSGYYPELPQIDSRTGEVLRKAADGEKQGRN